MAPRPALDTLRPHWIRTAGALQREGAVVRSVCCSCATPLRVDLADIVARHGTGYSLIDASERCRMVGCAGSAIYHAARTYGRPWIMLVDDPDLRAAADRATATTA